MSFVLMTYKQLRMDLWTFITVLQIERLNKPKKCFTMELQRLID